jgi:hypothetical protein
MSTPVRRDQFEISPKGIAHTPTGATYTPHPGAPHSRTLNLSKLGNALATGEDYRPNEVQTMGAVVGGVRRRKSSSLRGARLEGPAPSRRPPAGELFRNCRERALGKSFQVATARHSVPI